jgi:hypothetical protein
MFSSSPWQLSLIHFACTGEVMWGQLAAFVSGMKSSSRDVEYLNNPCVSPWRFRAVVRPNIWHVPCFLPPSILLTAVCHPLLGTSCS